MKKALIGALGIFTFLCVKNIEVCYGVCTSYQGDGMVYNADPDYNYISYRRTEAKPTDEVITVLILNPTNFAPDDYIYRKDWVLR